MTFDQIINIEITVDEVKEAIIQAQQNAFIDNLRNRHPNVSFDSKLRGYIGEIGLSKWFASNNIILGDRNVQPDDFGLDIDFEYKGLSMELKTSLIPDIDGTLETAFNKRDIKLIKRSPTIEELEGDIHIQVFYKHKTKEKDQWLSKQTIDLTSKDIDYLYEALLGRAYLKHTFLFCWIDKDTLVKRINALPTYRRTWSYAMREFWVCPLRTSYPPQELIKYLENL